MAILALMGIHGGSLDTASSVAVDVARSEAVTRLEPTLAGAPRPDHALKAERRLLRAVDILAALLIAVMTVGEGLRRWATADVPSSAVVATATGARLRSRRGPPALA